MSGSVQKAQKAVSYVNTGCRSSRPIQIVTHRFKLASLVNCRREQQRLKDIDAGWASSDIAAFGKQKLGQNPYVRFDRASPIGLC